MNDFKQSFAVKTDARSLEDACVGADVLIGVSKADLFADEKLL